MLKGTSHVTGLTEYFPTLANSYSNAVLLEMIRSGEGKPLPLELSQVMDSMHWWGLREDVAWHDNVVFILSRQLDKGGPAVHNKRDFVRNLISLQIQLLIQPYHDIGSPGFYLLHSEWKEWFDGTYRIEVFDGNFCFRWVAIKCFDHMQEIIEQFEHVPMNTTSN